MTVFNLFYLLGGLALFLYGMNAMGESLEKLSGGKLQKTLEKMTSGLFKGILLGAAVTAVIQSSSATTVMVVGFVNSGIIQLGQAVGIIMGANIGTTVTAWLISLTGLQGDNIFIQLLKPANFSPILAFIGMLMIMFSKKQKRKDMGTILLGFAILMFGMEMMSDAVAPLANETWFTSLFLTLSKNPLLGILAGAVLTGILQSSSASVGILQALSATGAITFGSAFPIVMGQNIGTCITALISCIGAKKNAKRAALVHLYFNIIGVTIISILFYAINSFVQFEFVTETINAAGIAVIHTAFNVLATIILVPMNKLIVKLAEWTIKDDNFDRSVPFIDERFLNTPAIATEQCLKMTVEMGTLAKDIILKAFSCLDKYDEATAKEIKDGEERADIYEDVLGSYLVQLSSKSLTIEDSRAVARLINTIGDLERISDHAVNILNVAAEMRDKKISFSKEAKYEISVMISAVTEILNLTIDALEVDEIDFASYVDPLEEVIDELKSILKKNHVIRLQNGTCTIELGFVLSDLLTNLERISAHCSNIVGYMLDNQEQMIGTHEYLKEVIKTTPEYKQKYKEYRDKYITSEIKKKKEGSPASSQSLPSAT